MTEIAFYQYLLAGAASIMVLGVTIIGWFLVQQMADYREHKEDANAKHEAMETVMGQHEKNVMALQLDISNNYARKANVEAQMLSLHQTMQEGFRDQRNENRETRKETQEIRKDIAALGNLIAKVQ